MCSSRAHVHVCFHVFFVSRGGADEAVECHARLGAGEVVCFVFVVVDGCVELFFSVLPSFDDRAVWVAVVVPEPVLVGCSFLVCCFCCCSWFDVVEPDGVVVVACFFEYCSYGGAVCW